MRKFKKSLIVLGVIGTVTMCGVGTQVYAASSFSTSVSDRDGVMHSAWGSCSAGRTSGSAYTTVSSGAPCTGSVSATYICRLKDGTSFSQGDAAGGVHGAGINIYFSGNSSSVEGAYISASHLIGVPGRCVSRSTSDTW